jgi:predicted GNAT family acetyltransferase
MPLPSAAEVLALTDLNMVAMYSADTRATPGGEVSEADGLVMCVTPQGTVVTNMVIVTGSVRGTALRDATARMYDPRGVPYSVWTRAHAHERLEEELADLGFTRFHEEPGMVLGPEDGVPVAPPAGVDIRPVTDHRERETFGRLMAAAYGVYGTPKEATRERFATLASVAGADRVAFLAYRDERAVAGAMLHMAHGVGGVNWVGTLPGEFGRGYGAAVTWAVVEEGRRRGARFMNLQASPMGERLYRRLGFATATHYRVFVAFE